MDIWTVLQTWAEKRLRPVIVTLLESPNPEDQVWVGRIAAAPGEGDPVQGDLTGAGFWPGDLGALAEVLAGEPPEWGWRVEVNGRSYLVSPLTYNRSALVLGGGHVGGAVSRLMRFLEFEVTLMDDRPEFLRDQGPGISGVEAGFDLLNELFRDSGFDAAIIVTRGHAQDSACLRQLLSWPEVPPYLGMIGSRRRTSATLEMLAGEGFPPERLGAVHTPIGLNIGAQTPEEIAVAIAAEVISVLNGSPVKP